MFDPYYETKVNPRWGRLPVGSILGGLLVLLGIASFIFSIIDLSKGVAPDTGSAWQENSIWPTIGKGIWVGAIMVATGLVGIISQRERTQVSLYVFNALCWVTAVFSLYQLLSSILHIEPYGVSGLGNYNNRTNRQNHEVALNSLLIASGGLGFITSIAAGILSCLAGNCCVDRRRAVSFLLSSYGYGYQPIAPLPGQQVPPVGPRFAPGPGFAQGPGYAPGPGFPPGPAFGPRSKVAF